jgi:DNA-binding transcriptional LysR family regulator
VGRVHLSVPRAAVPFVIAPVLPTFRERLPRIEVGDLPGGPTRRHRGRRLRRGRAPQRGDPARHGAGAAHRFIPLRRGGRPQLPRAPRDTPTPEDLLRHECVTFRSRTTGSVYAWQLERGRRNWRIPRSRTGADVHLRTVGVGAPEKWASEAGARALPPRSPAFSSSPPVAHDVPGRSAFSSRLPRSWP